MSASDSALKDFVSESALKDFVWPPPPTPDSDIVWLEPPPTAKAEGEPSATAPEDPKAIALTETPIESPTPAPAVPLSRVLASDVDLKWHEAVAVVQQLADQLRQEASHESAKSLPRIDDIELESTGQLRVRLEAHGRDPIVRGLGQLLQRLLIDGQRPVALRLVAMQAASSGTTVESIDDLRRELARFERPRRLETLAALYERARRSTQTTALAPPVDRSIALPVQEAQQVPEMPVEPEQESARSIWQRHQVLVASLALAAAAVLLFLAARTMIRDLGATASEPTAVASVPSGTATSGELSRSGAAGPRNIPAARASRRVPPPAAQEKTSAAQEKTSAGQEKTSAHAAPAQSKLAQPTLAQPALNLAQRRDVVVLPPDLTAAFGRTNGPWTREVFPSPSVDIESLPTPAVGGNAEDEFRRARALFDQKNYVAAEDRFRRVILMLDQVEPNAARSELRWIANQFTAVCRAALSRSPEARVYDASDDGIVEPMPLRHYFPDQPATTGTQMGVLELVIDARGTVETVRLVSPGNRYRERWWVSAAKAWRFHPALKDGHPVKFRTQIVITDLKLYEPQ